MNKQFTGQQAEENIFVKYKKWFIAVIGVQVIPSLLLLITFLGIVIYNYVGSEIRWHPYKQYIYGGYNIGLEEGIKDRNNMPDTRFGNDVYDYIEKTPWNIYSKETATIKERTLQEKEEYLAQFSESERSTKRADMRIQNIKLPLEKTLKTRHLTTIDFYTDYVDKKVKSETYSSEKEYNKALQEEAWRVGFEYGYAKGRIRDYKAGSL